MTTPGTSQRSPKLERNSSGCWRLIPKTSRHIGILAEIFGLLGDDEREQHHRRLHSRYKLDDNAAEVAIPAASRKYPAGNHAAEALVIYDLQRESGNAAARTDGEPSPNPATTQ